MPPPERVRLWLLLASATLLTLGAVVLFGWLTQHRLLVDLFLGFPPMPMNTAILFCGCGLALASLTYSRRLGLLAALGVELLALAILTEHLLGVDLGIDQASVTPWASEGYAVSGRPAGAVALAFACAAGALILLFLQSTPRTLRYAHRLAMVILVLSACSAVGLALGLDALYPSYVFRGMSPTTTLGLLLLGSSLLIAIRTRSASDTTDEANEADHRIVSVGTLMLVTVALVTGLPMFFLVKVHIENGIATGLQAGLDTEVRLIDNILGMRIERAAIVSHRPDIVNALKALKRNPADALALAQLQNALDQFLPHGFTALKIVLPAGQTVVSSGRFQADPMLEVTLDSLPGQRLQWNEGYVLRSRDLIRDGEVVLAAVEMEQSLPQMAGTLSDGQTLGKTGELQLCKQDVQQILCFPSRFQSKPLRLDVQSADPNRLVLHAVHGGSGIHRAIDHRGEPVVGVYAPVKNHGLFVALKIDAAELYDPLRRQIEKVLTLALLTIIGGSLLFRKLVRPLAGQLVIARESSQDKSRTMQSLLAFQRAVFEQAPDGILVADHEGRIVEANERIATLFGYSRENLKGKQIEELVPQSVRSQHHQHRAAFQKAPSTRVMSRDRTLQGQRADGSEFPIEVALAPMISEEGDRVIAIVKDVSEARQAERLIRDALKEKDLLLGEIHHRVKNNLQIVYSLLDMQAEMTTDAGAASALRDSQARIQSMALIHQTLYQSHDFAKVDFGVFLDTLMSHQQSSYGRSDLSLSSRSDTVRLAIDRAIPCGLIVNELVTNALKHAFPDHRPGSVLVEMRLLEGDRVEVAVSDDGVGIPESVNLKALTSLGMQLVQVLSEQLHAELTIQRRNPTRISFSFPLQ